MTEPDRSDRAGHADGAGHVEPAGPVARVTARSATAPTDLAEVASRFGTALHLAGAEVGPQRAGRFAGAVHLARPTTTRDLYWLGRVTLVADAGEIEIYDRVFDDVFRGRRDVADDRGDPGNPDVRPARRSQRRSATDETVRGDRAAIPTPMARRDAHPGHGDELGDDAPSPAPASSTELLRRRDFADCTPDELEALRALVRRLELDPPRRLGHRRRRDRRGDLLDRRATIRRARTSGGHPQRLVHRRRVERERRVVLIADVSGSMESYARAYLHLLHGTTRSWRAETFVFATRLTRLTPSLRHTTPDVAMRAAMADVDDWSGGTRIGAALAEFNDRWGRRGMARGAVVVILSDGWERDDPAELGEQMARLARLAHRIVWVNPRSKSDRYEPLVGGMAAALPHVDRLASGHDLAALDDVLDAIRGR